MAGKSKITRLRGELDDLLNKVDQEGLEFLIRQARTIVHNLEVDRVNLEIQRLGQETVELAKDSGSGVSPPERAQTVKVTESAGKKSFVLDVGGKRKVFSLEEMRRLARICQDAPDAADGSSRLYNWFHRNRSDVFVDYGIGNARHPALPLIYGAIRERYRPKAD